MLIEAQGASLPETRSLTVILLGTPFSSGQPLLVGKTEELMQLSRRLELMPSHDSIYLLRNVFTATRIMNGSLHRQTSAAIV